MERGALPETEPSTFSAEERRTLLGLAKDSVHYGVAYRRPVAVRLELLPERLQRPAATFVTLNRLGRLRGCIGRLEAGRPLAEDVAHNAFAAAFLDRRFMPVGYHELDELTYHISVLSHPQPMSFESEADLIGQLRPGVDGLILEEGGRRGTFLPAVWATMSDPKVFLAHLKVKAGLPADFWSADVRIWRYTAESVE